MRRRFAVPEVTTLRGAVPDRAEIRRTTVLGLALGSLDVVTTAEHMLVPPMSDGNPILMAVGGVSPWLAYGGFVVWFLLVATLALARDDALGYGADTYLLAAFSLTGVANAAYFVLGTTVFKEFVGQYTALTHLYIVVLAPVGSLAVGYLWASRRYRG
ncbi:MULTISPECIES: hypothetical protein [Salinibaculum]|uniref:hypothetical protein n=1 Tax=Salinibaculum TaxID=2732368 RepID=UPI0030D3E7E5